MSSYKLERTCNRSGFKGLGRKCPVEGNVVYVREARGPRQAVSQLLEDSSKIGDPCELCGSFVTKSRGVKAVEVRPQRVIVAEYANKTVI